MTPPPRLQKTPLWVGVGTSPAQGDPGGMLGPGAPAILAILTTETSNVARATPRIRAAE